MSRFQLLWDDHGASLSDTYSLQNPLRVSFCDVAFRQRLQRAGRRSELIVRAVRAKAGVRVLDCTAGLGREACLMAHLGCEVTLLERSRVIGELLHDGIERLRGDAELAETGMRMSLQVTDAAHYLAQTDAKWDVIYLDPMFPDKKGSAAVSGDMQILQRYLGVDEDAESLLELALRSEQSRIVLKRPPRSDWQPPVAPLHVFSSRNSCYEVFGR